MAIIKDLSIQLYSLRDETQKDFAATLQKVAAIGYTGVEFAGYGGIPADEMKQLLQKLGLRAVGSHVPVQHLQENLDEVLAYNKTIGAKAIVIPHYEYNSAQDIRDISSLINQVAPKITGEGFVFGYHNHAAEFSNEFGASVMDQILEETKNSGLTLELDVYWAAFAGLDVMQTIEKYKNHLSMLHLKQIENMDTKKNVDLGEGMIDFAQVIQKGRQIGIEDFIYEQEMWPHSPLASAEASFQHIMNL